MEKDEHSSLIGRIFVEKWKSSTVMPRKSEARMNNKSNNANFQNRLSAWQLLAVCMCGFVSGCGPSIKYGTALASKAKSPSADYKISVLEFKDYREDSAFLSDFVFSNNIGHDDIYCYNNEFRYRNEKPAIQISRQLAEHINASGVFSSSSFGDSSSPYLLSGEIHSFSIYAAANSDMRDAFSAGGGLGVIGGIAVAAMASKAEMQYEIKYKNIQMKDSKGNTIFDIPEFVSRDSTGIVPFTDCNFVYTKINQLLFWHNERLVKEIKTKL